MKPTNLPSASLSTPRRKLLPPLVPPARSLLEQLHAAEQDVHDQRIQLHASITALGSNVQQRMTSPGNLLWAAGLGFLASEFTRCKRTPPAESNDVATDTSPPSQPIGIMTTALKYVAIARSLAATATALWHEYGPKATALQDEETMEVAEHVQH